MSDFQKIVLLIIVAVCAYFAYQNYDPETNSIKETKIQRVYINGNNGESQQAEAHKVKENL